jgi:ribosomal protein S18 acetylase RimI-like enzyme
LKHHDPQISPRDADLRQGQDFNLRSSAQSADRWPESQTNQVLASEEEVRSSASHYAGAGCELQPGRYNSAMQTTNQKTLFIHDCNRAVDAFNLNALDISFTSDFVYAVVPAENSLELRLDPATVQIRKRFSIELDQPVWDQGYVAMEDGKLCGFIATRYESWNRRLAIVHFYVDRQHRRQGIGRRLMERAIDFGRLAGARTAWLETSNCNHPGILAYQRLGFSLCGFDLSLYQGTPSEREFAIYLARPIVR